MKNIIKYSKNLCEEHGAKLLYLCTFGSHLYGTNTPSSDMDYKGVFLPSKQSCILGDSVKTITRTTGDANEKNGKDDIDVQLWSLQYFLKLVSQGETNALDLLYSHTYPEMIHYITATPPFCMTDLFNNHSRLFNLKDCKAFIGYAIGQARKYGIKGSRLGVIKDICNWLMNRDHENLWVDKKLEEFIPEIIKEFGDSSYCFTKIKNGKKFLVVCGKFHQENISVEEFAIRIQKDYERYGERAMAAERNEGIDWKALSHAMRAISQIEQLIDTGWIKYPLANAHTLKLIKEGVVKFKVVEKDISQGVDRVKDKLESLDTPAPKKDSNLIDSLILKFYEEKIC